LQGPAGGRTAFFFSRLCVLLLSIPLNKAEASELCPAIRIFDAASLLLRRLWVVVNPHEFQQRMDLTTAQIW
jgi:hypothetical protein